MTTATYEFRLIDKVAREVLPGFGEQIGIITRKLVLKFPSAEFDEVASLVQAWRATPARTRLITAWWVKRKYSESDLNEARYWTIRLDKIFEPAAVETGTTYLMGCVDCGAGRQLNGQLRVDTRRLHKSAVTAATVAGDEWLVSETLGDVFASFDLQLESVHDAAGRQWLRLWSGETVALGDETLVGIDPFEARDLGAVPHTPGHVAAPRLISEPTLSRLPTRHLALTSEYFGVASGQLVPAPVMLVSDPLKRMLERTNATKHLTFELAHLEGVS